MHVSCCKTRILLLAVVFCGSGCGSNSPGGDDGGEPDADPGGGFSCEQVPQPGDAFELRVGLKSSGDFQELLDGDVVPVVLGGQGLYMMELDVRATLSIPSDSICLGFVAEVGPWGDFEGVRQPGVIGLRLATDGSFRGLSQIILAGGPDMARELDGADVQFTMSCDGHGFSGDVQRDLHLALEE